MSNNFAVIGVAGYIAPRHLQAIKETGNRIVAALDPSDSVGILDQYSDEVAFTTDPARFAADVRSLASDERTRVHYVSICSPNDVHESHVRLAFELGCDAICEKPLTLTGASLDAIEAAERASGRRVFTILQLRLHPKLLALKAALARTPNRRHAVTLTYITPRGQWYHASWKGNVARSGGLATNIGIHLFDLLLWLFGRPTALTIDLNEPNRVSGSLGLERADVRWYLSIDRQDLPETVRTTGGRTFRELIVDESPVEFTDGFTDLHTKVYRSILAGHGFGIADVRPSVELVERIRTLPPTPGSAPSHPLAARRGT